jgi:hypothetical protein
MGNIPYDDAFLEMSRTTRDSRVSFVVLDARGVLANRIAKADEFSKYCTGESTATFYNLGKDALLTIPCPSDGCNAGIWFCKTAPIEIQMHYWSKVFDRARSTREPIYISTDGRSVPWLHVRMETTPKYYKFSEFIM